MGERVLINPSVKLRRPASPLPRIQGALSAVPQKAAGVLAPVGGWRQVTFAFGLAFCLGGIGDVFDCAVMLFIGGLLIGLALRVPWLKG
jgi:hypothetical protein